MTEEDGGFPLKMFTGKANFVRSTQVNLHVMHH